MSDVQAEAGSNQRLLSLQTALGQDVLQPVSFHAEEAINAPFLVTVETVSERASIDPDTVLYQPACLKVRYGPGDPRILHGIVRAFSAGGRPVPISTGPGSSRRRCRRSRRRSPPRRTAGSGPGAG